MYETRRQVDKSGSPGTQIAQNRGPFQQPGINHALPRARHTNCRKMPPPALLILFLFLFVSPSSHICCLGHQGRAARTFLRITLSCVKSGHQSLDSPSSRLLRAFEMTRSPQIQTLTSPVSSLLISDRCSLRGPSDRASVPRFLDIFFIHACCG